MSSWDQLQKEIRSVPTAHDQVRRGYLKELSQLTGRNLIVYYSGWHEKTLLLSQGLGQLFAVNDADKNGFMATIHGLDRTLGLDLILHTPGGDVAATESLVDYLKAMFNGDIRVIVPHLAMSAGTMIALSSKEIVMGKHSSLGPIDPQINGVAAHGLREEFERARTEIQDNQANIAIWQPVLAKYTPTLVGDCEKAIRWAETITTKWLIDGMFAGAEDAEKKAKKVVEELSNHSVTLSHNRHYSAQSASDLGLNVTMLEDDPKLQEAVLTVHHACILTLSETGAVKIIENQNGAAHITALQMAAQSVPGHQSGIPAGAPAAGEHGFMGPTVIPTVPSDPLVDGS